MPLITKLQPQRRSADRFNLFIDGHYLFPLPLELVVKYHLETGKALTQTQLHDLNFQAVFYFLWEKILNYLSFRPRSVLEVKRRLHHYLQTLDFYMGDRQVLIETLLSKLLNRHLLDDYDFVVWFLRGRLQNKLKSRRELIQELSQKGIDVDLVDQVLVQLNFDEKSVLKRLLTKKARHYSSPRQLIAYLTRRGFSYVLVRQTTAEFFN